MLKTISAAFLAASVIAAPAFAAQAGKTTTQAPVTKSEQTGTKASSTAVKTGAKLDSKTKAMNANAAISPSEHKAVHKHRQHHKMVSAKKQPKAQPDVTKPTTTEKRS